MLEVVFSEIQSDGAVNISVPVEFLLFGDCEIAVPLLAQAPRQKATTIKAKTVFRMALI